MNDWYVYLLECSDGSLYCGCTNDIKRRVEEHSNGNGSKYTRSRLPVNLVALKSNLSKSEAHKLEYKVKKLNKLKKIIFLQSI